MITKRLQKLICLWTLFLLLGKVVAMDRPCPATGNKEYEIAFPTHGPAFPLPFNHTATASAGTILCNGDSTILTVTVTGGTGPFGYSIDGGTNYKPGNTFFVGAGTYIVTVID